MLANLHPGCQKDLSSSSSSPSSATLVLRPRENSANTIYDLQLCDIIDVDVRQKVARLLPSYPSYPVLYLVYVLVRSGESVQEARDHLSNTHKDRARYIPDTLITDLKDIKDDTMREKVGEIRKIAPFVTIFWAFYTLRVCDSSEEYAIDLIFENIFDASTEPVAQRSLGSTAHGHSSIGSMGRHHLSEEPQGSSSSESDTGMFASTILSQSSGNQSFRTASSSVEPLSQVRKNSFIVMTEDEDDSTEEDTAAFSARPESKKQKAKTVDKGKGVDRSGMVNYDSDIDMNQVPLFEEGPQDNKHGIQDTNCKFCDKKLGNQFAKAKHESSCIMRTKQACIKCKGKFSKSNIRRHEYKCDGRQISRNDASEFLHREASTDSDSSAQTSQSSSRSNDDSLDGDVELTEEESQKLEKMQEVFPHLGATQLCNSLWLSNYNLEEAIDLESNHSASNGYGLASGSQQSIPPKRKLGNPSFERTSKKPRTQNEDENENEDEEAIIQPASQWIETTFLHLCQDPNRLTIVHFSSTESRPVPTKLMCDNSEYLKNLINSTGNRNATVNEIKLQDVEPTLFDAIIQYMVCRNVSFGPQFNEIQEITTMVNFLVLAEKLKVAGPATMLLKPLRALLRKDRKNPCPMYLKVGHVHKLFSNTQDPHPIRSFFVDASVKPFMRDKNAEGSPDDSSEYLEVSEDNVEFRNQPAHRAWRLNKDFEGALIAKVAEALRNRRVAFASRNARTEKVYFTDPLDDEQFTLDSAI